MNEDFIKQFIQTKRFKYISSIFLLVLFSISLSLTFSSFTNNYVDELANVQLAGLEYSVLINGLPGNIIEVKANSTKGFDLVINSLNMIDAKYEISYEMCFDSTCNETIEKPSDLEIVSSSLFPNSITGTVGAESNVESRLILINTSSINYFVKLKINSGYAHNTLNLENKIVDVMEEKWLEESILVQEGGIAAIEAKATPDFSKIAGKQLTYKETISEERTTNLISNKNKAIGSGYTFNVDTGTYSLTSYETNKSFSTSYIGYYTCASTSYTNCSIMYKINAVSGSNITKAVLYSSTGDRYDLSTSGIFASEDDYGTSYYYRGGTEKNFVMFANMCWRIVRIVGDGSIKLVLYNYNPNSVDNPCDQSQDGSTNAFARYNGDTYTSEFNIISDDSKYFGYMYSPSGQASSSNRTQAQTNLVNSTIKDNVETWYDNNLNYYSDYLADTLWCNDREVHSGVGWGTGATYYKANNRLYSTKTPSLKCSQKNDRFTVSDTIIGNGNAGVPVGLLTADEIAFAGGVWNTDNRGYYLNQNAVYSWWTSSPSYTLYGGANMFSAQGHASFNNLWGVNTAGLRPSISLKSNTKIIGSGTSTNPYKVI